MLELYGHTFFCVNFVCKTCSLCMMINGAVACTTAKGTDAIRPVPRASMVDRICRSPAAYSMVILLSLWANLAL